MVLPLEQLVEGKYEIVGKIKEGGMGTIYKVRHRLLDEIRIIKVLQPQFTANADLRRRFQDEARIAIHLRHPNIAQLYDFSSDDEGNSYIVMEYIDGITLQEMLAKIGLPSIPFVIEICRQALTAFDHLHQRGFVHRDIAPDNLMLARNFDGLPLVKLIDLGIAKGLRDSAGGLTRTGQFLGKARYAAPEQFSGEGAVDLDQCSDIYSFGVMLYELLTGRSPIDGETFNALISGHLFRPPLAFAESDPDGRVPEGLREVVLKTLEKARDARIGTARELNRLLDEFADRSHDSKGQLEVILDRATRLVAEIKVDAAPGSSQDRLDRQFGMVTTNRPANMLSVEGTQVANLLANAQLLVRLEKYDKADLELQSLLEQDPGNQQAQDLLADVQSALAVEVREREAALAAQAERHQERERQALEERRAEAVVRIEALLGDGELDRGEKAIEEEAAKLGEWKRLGQMRPMFAAARKSRQQAEIARSWRRQIDHLIDQARQALAQGDDRVAAGHLETVLSLDPEHGEAEVLTRELEALRVRRDLERRIEELVDPARIHLAKSQHGMAIELLEQAVALDPEKSQPRDLLADARESLRQSQAVERKRAERLEAAVGRVEAPLAAPDRTVPQLSVPPVTQRPFPRKIAAAALGALLLVALVWWLAQGVSELAEEPDEMSTAAAPTNAVTTRLEIDAFPWGRVVRIVDDSGESHPIPESGYTPMLVHLKPGTYTVSLANPAFGDVRSETVVLGLGSTQRAWIEFGKADVDSYFEKAGW